MVFGKGVKKIQAAAYNVCTDVGSNQLLLTSWKHGELNRHWNKKDYRISANSFRGNYSFLDLALFTVTFDLYFINLNSCRGNYSREETIQGRKLFAEIRYSETWLKLVMLENLQACLYQDDVISKILFFEVEFRIGR